VALAYIKAKTRQSGEVEMIAWDNVISDYFTTLLSEEAAKDTRHMHVQLHGFYSTMFFSIKKNYFGAFTLYM
jgi:hypothetical protein